MGYRIGQGLRTQTRATIMAKIAKHGQAGARTGGMRRATNLLQMALGRIEILALFPLIALSASWFGFDDLALVTAVALSALLALSSVAGRSVTPLIPSARTMGNGRDALVIMLGRIADLPGKDSACILVQIENWAQLHQNWGHDTCEDIAQRVKERLQTTLRGNDLLVRLGDQRFGIVLSPVSSARLGLRDTIATRLSDAVAEPLPLRGTALRLTAAIGHSALRKHGPDPAQATFKAAEAALGDAALNGPGAIRAFAPGIGHARALQAKLSEEVEDALHTGAITAWFQPQIHAQSGTLSGMETLARWQHPKHGLLGPKEFLSAVEAGGHMPLLGQTMRHQALKSLQDWDRLGANVPMISVTLSAEELRDPSLARTLASEVARYDLAPERIAIEILDNVATKTDDDAIIAALQTLRDAGHRLDLDGFGLGATSLPTLQRYGVTRLKIDRSFTLDVDVAPAKQQAVSALIAIGKALGIETLARGVETVKQKDALRALGCDHLQGFVIAKPLSRDKVADWARARSAAGKTIRLDDRRA